MNLLCLGDNFNTYALMGSYHSSENEGIASGENHSWED